MSDLDHIEAMQSLLNISSSDLNLTKNIGEITFYSFICFMTVIGNGFIILLVKVEPRLRSVSNVLIINLAIADAAVGIAVQPFLAILEVNDNVWLYDDIFCDLWISFDYLFCSSSFLSMYAISFDRYWSLIVETKVDLNKNLSGSRRRAFILIILAWLIPLSVWVPSVFINRKIYGPSLTHECNYRANSLFILICCVLFYYLPMIMMLVFYAKIFRMLNNQINKLSSWLTEIDLEIFRNLSSSTMSSDVITNMSLLSNQCANRYNQQRIEEIKALTPTLPRKLNKKDKESQRDILFKFKNRLKNTMIRTSINRPVLLDRASSNTIDLFNRFKSLSSLKSRNSKKKTSNFNKKSNHTQLASSQRQLKYSRSNVNMLNENNNNFMTGNTNTNLKRHSSYIPETFQKSATSAQQPNHMINFNANLMRKINSKSAAHQQQRLRLLKQQRVSRMIGILIVVFLICWLPFTISTSVQAVCENCLSKRLFNNIIWCKYLNSTLNPLLYVLTNKVS